MQCQKSFLYTSKKIELQSGAAHSKPLANKLKAILLTTLVSLVSGNYDS